MFVLRTTIAAMLLVTTCASGTRAEDPAIVAFWQQDRARIDRELAQYRAGNLPSARTLTRSLCRTTRQGSSTRIETR